VALRLFRSPLRGDESGCGAFFENRPEQASDDAADGGVHAQDELPFAGRHAITEENVNAAVSAFPLPVDEPAPLASIDLIPGCAEYGFNLRLRIPRSIFAGVATVKQKAA